MPTGVPAHPGFELRWGREIWENKVAQVRVVCIVTCSAAVLCGTSLGTDPQGACGHPSALLGMCWSREAKEIVWSSGAPPLEVRDPK